MTLDQIMTGKTGTETHPQGERLDIDNLWKILQDKTTAADD